MSYQGHAAAVADSIQGRGEIEREGLAARWKEDLWRRRYGHDISGSSMLGVD